MSTQYEAVIGLEVHCQVLTASKMFCTCPNEFGAEPNTNVFPVCMGHPGVMPVPNKEAIRKAVEALAHDAYFRHTRQLLAKDFVTEDELENHNYLYTAYHTLGLNSTGDQLHRQVMQKMVKTMPDPEIMKRLP
jgi:Asp-tRNA(Asn)/Glu-tRNA(Gln) amidotransferase B subunit